MEKNKVNLYLANIKNADSEKLYEQYKLFMEPLRIKRIENSINPKNRKVEICTGVLLQGVLKCFGVTSDDIYYGPQDKPYLKNRRDVFYNISHSGDYVLIGVSGQPIGVDIQKPVMYKEALVNRICTPEERETLSNDLVKHLNKVWAIKEAYTKLTGQGIAKEMKEITYREDDGVIKVMDNNVFAAEGKIVYADDLYEAVFLTREPFDMGEINQLIM